MTEQSAATELRSQGHPIGDVYLSRAEIAGRVCELGAALAAARALYRELARRFPSSGFLARIPPHLLDAR